MDGKYWYIAHYKHISNSQLYRQILQQKRKKVDFLPKVTPLIQLHANSLHAFNLIVIKFINKLIAEYNWLVQKVCHLLLDIPLSKSLKNVITLDCRQEDDWSIIYEFKDGQLRGYRLFDYEKYKHWPNGVKDITFFIIFYFISIILFISIN